MSLMTFVMHLEEVKLAILQVMGPTPQAYTWALENKIFACLMVSDPLYVEVILYLLLSIKMHCI